MKSFHASVDDEQQGVAQFSGRPKVALLCDYLEEGWVSMDYYADTMYTELKNLDVEVTSIRPQMPRWFSHLPGARREGQNADRVLGRFWHYPRHLRPLADQFHLFHITDHSYAHLAASLPPGRVVITCHDVDAFRCLIDPAGDPRPAWFRALARQLRGGLEAAAHIICDSEATRDALVRHGLSPAGRTTVVHLGVHPTCKPDPDRRADAEAKEKLSGVGTRRYVLNVGTTIPRKRIDVLLRTFAAVRAAHPDLMLVRAGGAFTPEQSELAHSLGVSQHIVHMPFLSREVLASVYRNAALALFPSESEGFGLPVIEAAACGVPVVASDLEIFREVGGDAVEYCGVANVTAWSARVIEMLRQHTSDQAGWGLRRQAVLRHAARFAWSETARHVAQIYANVYQSTCPQRF